MLPEVLQIVDPTFSELVVGQTPSSFHVAKEFSPAVTPLAARRTMCAILILQQWERASLDLFRIRRSLNFVNGLQYLARTGFSWQLFKSALKQMRFRLAQSDFQLLSNTVKLSHATH